MSSMTSHKQQILENVSNAFAVTDEQLNFLMEGYNEEMKAGLAIDRTLAATKTSELKMIPSYVTGYPTGNEKGTYLALEISGIDIYVCQVKLKGEGGKLAINQYQYKIPDNLTAGDDINVLIDYVADCVVDFQTRVGTHKQTIYSMAISIGFAVLQTGLDKGKIIAFEHGFDFPNVIGCDAVDLFDSRFRAKGLGVKIVAMANDGVCTLLAHAYQHPSTRIGVIHSAGTNCAYYDKMSNIGQFKHDISGNDMIINTEWCNFGARHLPKTDFDSMLDSQSNNPGIHNFEKMTTGMYLGEIVRQILIFLMEQRVLSFQVDQEDEDECLLLMPYQFDTSYMYVCEADTEDLEDTRLVLEDMCRVSETTLEDRAIVKKVCELVGHRAALLLGASIAGVVTYMVQHGIGLDEEKGFAIAISGDVYKDYPSFHPRVCEAIKDLIPDEVASKLSVGIVQHSRIVGAAIVAMMAEKMDQEDTVMS
ncbi:actin-like ATPase domain-containing protein, partial [Backusella circina FSU 941]